jgi:hexosaminidase
MDIRDRTEEYWQVRTLRLCPSLLCFCFFLMGPAARAAARPPLIPQPHEYTAVANLSLRNGVRIPVPGDAEDRFAADDLGRALRERGVRLRESATALRIEMLRDNSPLARAVLHREHMTFDAAMQPEGYILVSVPHRVVLIAHTAAGIFYGAQTLKQLVIPGGEGPLLAGAVIRDWPAMRWRGVHDDLSRGPVPTLAFQEEQIRTFAAYKLNVYSPYFENTMQYASNPLPALPGGSISAADARALVAYARRYHVTIIPEQEAFGHLHHVLTWQEYAPLAEIPNGAVLAPGQPGSMQLITQWFDELAGLYPGRFLHIGADETFELGQGQTASAVQQRGLGAVYIDFLTRIHQSLAPLHRRLLFWGDMAMRSPAIVPQLPRDMIAVPWVYEPEPNGFRRWIAPYRDAGMENWVAPGVNNWNRVWPNFNLALANIQRFVADGQQAGSTGMLNTIWNDDGEGLFLEDWYAVLFGAEAAWQPGSADVSQFERDYGPVFHGDATDDVNAAQQALMDAQQKLQQAGLDDARDAYFWVDPWSPAGRAIGAKMRPVSATVRLDAERALTLLARAKQTGVLRETDALEAMDLGARRIDFLAFQFQTAEQIADGYRRLYDGQKTPAISAHISRDLWNLAGVNGRCEDLRDGYKYLETRYSDVWLRENRPFWLDVVTARYDAAAQRWADRAEKLTAARDAWNQHQPLPSPGEIGIPVETP